MHKDECICIRREQLGLSQSALINTKEYSMEYSIQLRKQAGKAQKDMAEYLGISRQAYLRFQAPA